MSECIARARERVESCRLELRIAISEAQAAMMEVTRRVRALDEEARFLERLLNERDAA